MHTDEFRIMISKNDNTMGGLMITVKSDTHPHFRSEKLISILLNLNMPILLCK